MRIIKIGRNPDNDIVINDETTTVSGYHAIIKVYDDGTLTICDISKNGTFVNGVKAIKGTDIPIKKGDDIRFAKVGFLDWGCISLPDNPIPATVMAAKIKDSYSIGTESDNSIIISDPARLVSRHHAILKLKANGNYFIYDQSTNGTFVNGEKIKTKVDYPVTPSDTISLAGSYQLDWTKIPNVPVPIPAKPTPSKPEIKADYSAGKEFDYSKLIYWSIGIALFLISFYFKFYADDSKQKQATEKEQTAIPTDIRTEAVQSETSISSLYERNKSAVFVIITSDGTNSIQGSGFFISSLGVAVSNYHVFKGTYRGLEEIRTLNGNYKIEKVLAKDENMDYIIFKVADSGQSFPYLRIANSIPKVGENVFAIGNPKGLDHTLSTGIVSALRQNDAIIQTTTEITHGSSGGPLFNMQGEVIGITTAGLGEANLNFAVNVVGLGFGNY